MPIKQWTKLNHSALFGTEGSDIKLTRQYLFLLFPWKMEKQIADALSSNIRSACSTAQISLFLLPDPGQTTTDKRRWSLPRTGKTIFSRVAFLWRLFRSKPEPSGELVLIGDDSFSLMAVALWSKKKPIYIPLIKVINRYPSFWDIWTVGRFCRAALVNDRKMNRAFRRNNIPSYFVGNPWVDLVKFAYFTFPHGKKPIYSFFMREEYWREDLIFFLNLVSLLSSEKERYFLLVLPPEVKLKELAKQAETEGWFFKKSLEGDWIDGYLWQHPTCVNITRFGGEAMGQSELVISTDSIRIIQAAGMGKKVLPVESRRPDQVAALVRNQTYLFENSRSLQDRFGSGGALSAIVSYLLRGTVEDELFKERLLKKEE
ncbi:MAG: hypothetical protein PWP04_1385 [Candidatus Atribacteria bacterium]|nr:hypothetical protein [Candidatus Atribacteria bacterium]